MKRLVIIILCLLLTILVVGNVCTRFFLDRFLFQGEKLDERYSFEADHPFEEVYIVRPDARLHGLYFPREQARGVVLFFHGNRRSVQRWAKVADQFLSRGYAVFMIDYRGYGKSTGPMSEEAFYGDALAAYDWLKTTWTDSQIVVFGRSLGGAAATFTATQRQCRSLILETPFYSIPDLFYTYARVLPPVFSFSYHFSNGEKLGTVTRPVSIILGGSDKVVPLRASIKLKAALKPTDTLVVIDEGGHNNLSSFPAYSIFLDRALEVK